MSEPDYTSSEIKNHETQPEPPSDDDMEKTELNVEQAGSITRHEDLSKSETKSSDVSNDDTSEHETPKGNMVNNDQQVPEVSKFVPETSEGNMKLNDQLVPEISDQFSNEVSTSNDTEFNDQCVPETVQSGVENSEYLVGQTSDADIKSIDEKVYEASKGIQENDQINISTSCDIVDHKRQDTLESGMGSYDQPELKSSASNLIDDSSRSSLNNRNNGQQKPELSTFDLGNDVQAKLESSEKENEIKDVCPEGDPSLQQYGCSTPVESFLSDKSLQGFQGEGDNLQQLSNPPLTSCAPSSHESSVSKPLYPILHGSRSLDENVSDASRPSIPSNSSPSQLYPDIKKVQEQESELPKIHNLKESMQEKQSEPPKRYPEKVEMQWDLGHDYKSHSVRNRAFKPSNVVETFENYQSSANLEKPMFLKQIIPLVILIVFIVFTATIAYFWFFTSVSRTDASPSDRFTDYISNLQQQFPNQSQRLWKTLNASTVNIFRNESKHPAIIIMASSTLHASVTLCIAKKISSGFELSWGLSPDLSLVDINHLEHLDPAQQKMQLDNLLDSAFSSNKRKSFIVENLQVVKPLSAMLFYKYCDNDYAPFKDVMILFTLYYDEKEGKIENPSAVENYIEKLWSRDLTVDKVKPLLSRIANNVVIVRGENSATLGNVCP